MADITDERLRKILERKLYFGLNEGQAIAAELRAARETIRSKDRLLPSLIAEGVALERERAQKAEAERDAARAQLHADDQRAWEALGKPEGTHDTTNVQRLCAEVERLRGIIDDIESESGHCHFLDDEEHEPPHLPDHVRAIVQERDAARAEVERLRCRVGWLDHLDTAEGRAVHADEALRVHSEQLRAERDALRAQLHADDQRAWEALGKPEGTHDTTNVQRLCAEVERLRADLREAMELLRDRQGREVRVFVFRTDDAPAAMTRWWARRDALLAKHKETP